MNILWISNSPHTNAGYGVITRNLLQELNKKHPSRLLCNWGIQSSQEIMMKDYDVPLIGQGTGGFEEGMIPVHYKKMDADVCIPIYDYWAFQSIHEMAAKREIIVCPYAFMDSAEPNPRYIELLKSAFRIIPPSKHSEQQFKRFYPEKTVESIPLGIDPNIYKPLWNTTEEKGKWKEKMGFKKDDFVILLAGDNKYFRKRWEENLRAIKIFASYPDVKNVKIFVHTRLHQLNPVDFDIPKLIKHFGLEKIARHTHPYDYARGVSDKEMAEFYNGADVFLQCSAGEGFGMMYLEAASCGTPSIGMDFTSVPEVIKQGETGYLVEPLALQMEPSMGYKAIPDPERIALELKRVYDSDTMKWRKNGPKFASDFHWDKIIKERWLPFLEQLEKDLDKACLKIPKACEELKKKAKEVKVIK